MLEMWPFRGSLARSAQPDGFRIGGWVGRLNESGTRDGEHIAATVLGQPPETEANGGKKSKKSPTKAGFEPTRPKPYDF